MNLNLHCSQCNALIPFYFKADDRLVSAKLIFFLDELKGRCGACVKAESSHTLVKACKGEIGVDG